MRFDKFTLKAQEAVQNAQEVASKKGHQQIEPEHLLYALLEQAGGIIGPPVEAAASIPPACSGV